MVRVRVGLGLTVDIQIGKYVNNKDPVDQHLHLHL